MREKQHVLLRVLVILLGLGVTVSLEGIGVWGLINMLHGWGTGWGNGSFMQAFDATWRVGGAVALMIAMLLLLVIYVMFVVAGITWDENEEIAKGRE